MYCVVHGGSSLDLRYQSYQYLTSLPFDGVAIGVGVCVLLYGCVCVVIWVCVLLYVCVLVYGCVCVVMCGV